MKILRLHVISFGKLCDYRLELCDGLNLLCEENGWGKSTLAVFIKAMLYGLPASSKRDLDQNERKKYIPWQGGTFGGSMEFTTQKGSFRVERTFGAKEAEDTFKLYDLVTNEESNVYSVSLGEELFGINAEGFERSTYLSQRRISETDSTQSITARLGSLLDAVDDIDRYDEAIEALEKRRKFYSLAGNKGEIGKTERELSQRNEELDLLCARDETRQKRAKELEELSAEFQLMESRSDELRHLRERAILHDNRKRIQNEISEKALQRDGIREAFVGEIPTDEELTRAGELCKQLSQAEQRLSLIKNAGGDLGELSRLQRRYQNGVPTDEQIGAWERENNTLIGYRARKEALEQSRIFGENGAWARIPSPDEIDRAYARLGCAEKAKKETFSLQQEATSPSQSPNRFLALLSLILGVGLLAYGAVFPQSDGMLPCLLIGAVALVLGAVLFWRSTRVKALKKQELNERLAALNKEERQFRKEVAEFLSVYGVSTEGDLSFALQQLSINAANQRTLLASNTRVATEIAEITAQMQEISHRLQARIRAFLPLLSATEDYRDVLEGLRRDAAELRRLKTAEEGKSAECQRIEEEKQRLSGELLPFLARYRTGSRSPSEHLQEMTEARSNHKRLCEEISKKQEEIDLFVKEKQLEKDEEVTDYDALREEDNALSARIKEAQRKKAELNAQLERLSLDTDRIPDVEAEISRLSEQLKEYGQSLKTIELTKKHLETAKSALSSRYLGGMQEAFREYLAALVGEDAPDAFVDTSFEVRLQEGGQRRDMVSFSQGWRDAVRFCLRLSLARALYADGEAPLLLLDDPFVNLDDRRLAAARGLLDTLATQYQIVYMVCRKE